MRARRIGIAGAAGVGKTTLATMLAAELELPLFEEEMRAHLVRTRRSLAALPTDEAQAILLAMWRGRAARERATPAFIADNACIDFAAYALYHGCVDGEGWDAPPELLRGPVEHLARYDAILVLPAGVLPYVRDGVRPPRPFLQLRYQHILDGLLRRHADPRVVHHLPEDCTSRADRFAWALRVLDPAPERGGIVHLVGAGPGDPGLLTVRAAELLRTADVIAHDALVPPAILALANPRAELLPVGRRHGGGPTTYRLHPAVLERARAGKTVVRLKAGDPMIFGRGGEEAEELTEAGIPFTIVPGISAALGAAACAGIPLTHRALASDVTFVSGHDSGGATSRTDWAALAAGTGTIAMYMAAHGLAANLARLVEGGRAPTTPAAYIGAASTPAQRVIVGTLATLAARIADVDPAVPALILVGEVVGLRDTIAWFERDRALDGRRLIVARARPEPSAIARALRGLGADVIEAPAITVVPASLAITPDADHAALLIGCAAGARAIAADLGARPVIAIGTGAAGALADLGITPQLALRGACAEALAEHAATFAGRRFLLVTSDAGRPALVNELTAVGAEVDTVVAYRQHLAEVRPPLPPIDLVVLPSSSAARNLLAGAPDALHAVPMVAMGPATEAAARAHGARHIVRAADDTPAALIACALATLGAP
ncbi:MAG: uroporphyrinogen-III C-methyltransferase [Deltaproteobacteria bacterium]|nr:uroporphyrinogen-III C-methyltransferase [Deltaproteobacteria bacterium]